MFHIVDVAAVVVLFDIAAGFHRCRLQNIAGIITSLSLVLALLIASVRQLSDMVISCLFVVVAVIVVGVAVVGIAVFAVAAIVTAAAAVVVMGCPLGDLS